MSGPGGPEATGPLFLGIRHHGPGSARAVRAALDAARPRAVLIEGPPEADRLAGLAADARMRPPVALLAHAVDDPGRAAFWPFAEFSPEWVALRWALDRGVPAHFIDLPATHTLALRAADEAEDAGTGPETDTATELGEEAAPGGTDRGRSGGAHGPVPGSAAHPDTEPGEDGDDRDDSDSDSDGGGTGRAGPAVGPGRAAGPGGGRPGADDPAGWGVPGADPPPEPWEPQESGERFDVPGPAFDPIAVLARTAGYDDPERWWDDVVEHRHSGPGAPYQAPPDTPGPPGDPGTPDRPRHPGRDEWAGRDEGAGRGAEGPDGAPPDPCAALAPFTALAEAMTELRAAYGHGGHDRDLVREAHMRLRLREARKEYGERVAVVCGAWHVPALTRRTTVAADRALLRGLPKVRAELTWVPWTHRRLARRSGYGAGIESPGWYAHLFRSPDRPVERWLTRVARLLREEDRHVSPAHVIEAVRLAGTLAALRGRPLAGLTEATDAVRAVMCDGSDLPLALIRDRLVIGDDLGEVPATAPAVPLQRDLDRRQRTLRLRPEPQERELELDLREESHSAKSRLLHRLRLLAVDWGEPVATRGSTGTFKETWRLRWEPELHVRVAEAGIWGTTVRTAATARAEHGAVTATTLAEVTTLAEQCLAAGLTDALPVVTRALADRAALDGDVGRLAQALPALARSLRYGDVRATDTLSLAEVAAGLAGRIFVGLPPACTGLGADAAEEMSRHLDAVHGAVGLLPGADRPADRWASVLRRLAARDTVSGAIRGRAARLLLDDGRLTEKETARLMGLALSPVTPPADAAAWIDGFAGGASGGGLLLVHDERLFGLFDSWLAAVPEDAFTSVLPLLRRTFSAYEPGIRRNLGELAGRAGGTGTADAGRAGADGRGAATALPPGFAPGLDRARADAVLPLLHLILGPGAQETDGRAPTGDTERAPDPGGGARPA
jgi:hypothetical protein